MSTINLEKGQKINISTEDGSKLSRVMMGLGWDEASGFLGMGKGSIDLDASCGLYSENKELLDVVSFRQLYSRDGSIRHSGDNRTGAGDGDDEKINVDLNSIPNNVKSIVFTINSWTGENFSKIKNCFCRLVDTVSNREFCVYKLAEQGNHTGMIMCKLYRHNGEWKFQAIGSTCNGRDFNEISRDVMAVL